jgi:hypothetical protein
VSLPPDVTTPLCLAQLEAPADCNGFLKFLGILCVNEHEAPLSASNCDSCSDTSAGGNDESEPSPPEADISQSTTPVNPSGLNIVATSIQDTRAMDELAAAAALQSTHFPPSF